MNIQSNDIEAAHSVKELSRHVLRFWGDWRLIEHANGWEITTGDSGKSTIRVHRVADIQFFNIRLRELPNDARDIAETILRNDVR